MLPLSHSLLNSFIKVSLQQQLHKVTNQSTQGNISLSLFEVPNFHLDSTSLLLLNCLPQRLLMVTIGSLSPPLSLSLSLSPKNKVRHLIMEVSVHTRPLSSLSSFFLSLIFCKWWSYAFCCQLECLIFLNVFFFQRLHIFTEKLGYVLLGKFDINSRYLNYKSIFYIWRYSK